MPFSQAFDDERQLLRTRVTGPITFDDIRRHVSERCRPQTMACAEIIDARGVTSVGVSFKDMLWTATRIRGVLGGAPAGRRAVIVDSDENVKIARIFASLAAGWMRVAVFDDADAAEAWLQAPAEAVVSVRR